MLCLGYLVHSSVAARKMAEQSLDLQQRKLDEIEANLLESDQEMEICDADLKEAEKQLDEPMLMEQKRNDVCVKCKSEFVPEFGIICEVESKHAYCISCVYPALIKQASCPSGLHCTKETDEAAWQFSTEDKKRRCNIVFMMDLLPKTARKWLTAGKESELVTVLGMSLGDYLKDKTVKKPPACPACKLQIEDSGLMAYHIKSRCKPRCLLKKNEFYLELPLFVKDFPAPPPQTWWNFSLCC